MRTANPYHVRMSGRSVDSIVSMVKLDFCFKFLSPLFSAHPTSFKMQLRYLFCEAFFSPFITLYFMSLECLQNLSQIHILLILLYCIYLLFCVILLTTTTVRWGRSPLVGDSSPIPTERGSFASHRKEFKNEPESETKKSLLEKE